MTPEAQTNLDIKVVQTELAELIKDWRSQWVLEENPGEGGDTLDLPKRNSFGDYEQEFAHRFEQALFERIVQYFKTVLLLALESQGMALLNTFQYVFDFDYEREEVYARLKNYYSKYVLPTLLLETIKGRDESRSGLITSTRQKIGERKDGFDFSFGIRD